MVEIVKFVYGRRSSGLRRSLFEECKTCVFGKDIGVNSKSFNGLSNVRTRRKRYGSIKKVRKLVPLKVPYKDLRPFRRELGELRLKFLLWNWNCISASICKEILDKNKTEGEDLRGNPLLWTVEHWTQVLGQCAGR